MRPVDWEELRDVCEKCGCRFDRIKGDHYIMVRDGMFLPIVIPMKKDLKEDIVLSCARTLGITSKQLRALLDGKRKE